MNKKLLAIFLSLLSLVVGYAILKAAEDRRENRPPVITRSFASKEVKPRESWKIYLNASDPDGDMQTIFAVIEQPGLGKYPVSIIRIKEENQKELSGYIHLNTSVSDKLDFLTLTLMVHIRDKAGNFSNPANFTFSFNSRSVREAPPQGIFKDQDLGPIMINLRAWDPL